MFLFYFNLYNLQRFSTLKQCLIYFKLIYMIYIIYIQRFTSVHLKPKFDLIYINLYLYLLIHLIYVLYSASIHHAGISAKEKQFYYYLALKGWRFA